MSPAAPDRVRFDRDTGVTPAGDGLFSAQLDTGWWIITGPNGGYLAAILLRALDATQGDPARAARALTAYFREYFERQLARV